VWELATGEMVAALGGHRAPVRSLAFSPSSTVLASAGLDRTVRLWRISATDVEAGRVLVGHTGSADSVSWEPGGTRLASGSDDGTVIIWDVGSE